MTLLYIFSKKTADTLMYIPTLCESKEKSLHLLFGLWVWLSNTDSKTSVFVKKLPGAAAVLSGTDTEIFKQVMF